MSRKLNEKVRKSRIGLRGADKAVLGALAGFADDDGSSAYPSITALADDAGYSRQTTYEVLDRLIALGLVTKTENQRFYGKGHYTVEYVINVNLLDSVKPVDSVQSTDSEQVDSVKSPDATHSKSKTDSQSGVSELVSEDGSLRSPSVDQVPKLVKQAEATEQEKQLALGTAGSAYGEELDYLRKFLSIWTESDLWQFWYWNQNHKAGKYRFLSIKQAWGSTLSNSDHSAMRQFSNCQRHPCPKCKAAPPLPWEDTSRYMEGLDDEVNTVNVSA